MPKIGILFDIDELENGLYGYAAYKVFFAALDSRQIAGCTLSDGDTNATLTVNDESLKADKWFKELTSRWSQSFQEHKNTLDKLGMMPFPTIPK
jgi:hypothetical protein